MSSFHKEMREALGAENDRSIHEVTRTEEIGYIIGKTVSLIILSFILYFSISLLISIPFGLSWEEIKSKMLIISFIIFAISAVFVAARALLGGYMMMFESIRVVVLNKSFSENKLEYLQSLVFGFKLDTFVFYGALSVFGITYLFLP